MQRHNIGIAGLGIVGGGVAGILDKNRAEIARRTGVELVLTKAAEKDAAKVAELKLQGCEVIPDASALIDDKSIHTVVEVIGGKGFAREFVMKAIAAGKNVVTANKALLAAYGPEIARAAREKGVSVGYEASTAGGVPIIRTLREAYIGDNIRRIVGILNGTSNYILTRMSVGGGTFKEALGDAQSKGYAEADPTLDISGADSSHKIVILARLAFGEDFPIESVYVEGIQGVTPADIKYAAELGYRIKLLALAKRRDDTVELRVHPALVKESHPLAHVEGVFNSVFVEGEFVGDTMLYGQGAGRWATASAVVADLIDVATGRARTVAWHDAADKLRVRPITDVDARYYIRFQAIDRPGVLATIAGVLGKNQISVASAMQKERRQGQSVPLVILTHQAKEGAVQAALSEIENMDVVSGKHVVLREEE